MIGLKGVPKWRYSLALDFENPSRNFGVNLKQRTVSGFLNSNETGTIGSHFQYDINFRLLGQIYGGDLKWGAINLLGGQPDYDLTGGSYIDTSLYNAFASYYVEYGFSF